MTRRESMVRNIRLIQKKVREEFTKKYDIYFYESTQAEAIELVIAALDTLIIDLDTDLSIQNLIMNEILMRIKGGSR